MFSVWNSLVTETRGHSSGHSACAPPDPAGTEAETINNNVTLRVSERLFGHLIDKQEGLTV